MQRNGYAEIEGSEMAVMTNGEWYWLDWLGWLDWLDWLEVMIMSHENEFCLLHCSIVRMITICLQNHACGYMCIDNLEKKGKSGKMGAFADVWNGKQGSVQLRSNKFQGQNASGQVPKFGYTE